MDLNIKSKGMVLIVISLVTIGIMAIIYATYAQSVYAIGPTKCPGSIVADKCVNNSNAVNDTAITNNITASINKYLDPLPADPTNVAHPQ